MTARLTRIIPKFMLMMLPITLTAVANVAIASDYPNKPVRLVLGYSAGGGLDTIARLLGQDLTTSLGQTVLVENRVGANGNIAAAHVAKAAPDGYTFLVTATPAAVNKHLYKKLPFDPDTDFDPVSLIGTIPVVLLAGKSIKGDSARDLVSDIKNYDPDTLNFAHGGVGTSEHLFAELFNQSFGIQIPLIPYRGGSEATTDLIGGRVQLMFLNQLSALPILQSPTGAVRALAITGSSRSQQLPNVATWAEQGLSQMDVQVDPWWGVLAPKGVPRPVLEKINQAMHASITRGALHRHLIAVGGTPRGGTPEDFGAFFSQQSGLWANVIRQGNVQPLD